MLKCILHPSAFRRLLRVDGDVLSPRSFSLYSRVCHCFHNYILFIVHGCKDTTSFVNLQIFGLFSSVSFLPPTGGLRGLPLRRLCVSKSKSTCPQGGLFLSIFFLYIPAACHTAGRRGIADTQTPTAPLGERGDADIARKRPGSLESGRHKGGISSDYSTLIECSFVPFHSKYLI